MEAEMPGQSSPSRAASSLPVEGRGVGVAQPRPSAISRALGWLRGLFGRPKAPIPSHRRAAITPASRFGWASLCPGLGEVRGAYDPQLGFVARTLLDPALASAVAAHPAIAQALETVRARSRSGPDLTRDGARAANAGAPSRYDAALAAAQSADPPTRPPNQGAVNGSGNMAAEGVDLAHVVRANVADLVQKADGLGRQSGDGADTERAARALYHEAGVLAFLAGIDRAGPVFDALWERGTPSVQAVLLRALTQVQLGRFAAAERALIDALARAGPDFTKHDLSLAQGLLSVAQRYAGARSQAAETLLRVIDSETRLQRPAGVAAAKASLALTWSEQGFTERAAAALEEAAGLAESHGLEDIAALTAFERGRAAYERGDWGQSRALLDDANRRYHDLRDMAGTSRTAEMLGRLMIEAGDLSGAERQFTRALAAAERAGLRSLAARAALELAQLCEQAGDLTSACDFWLRAREIYESVGNRAAIGPLEDKMRGAGCPTDWVLNDF